ncbi:putative F-box family protein [Hibiscus syriacus]|uniref:F-box family protein n=1 Tax=Hibiscus syriacus TaxID=106335 RepID=A0A6A2YIQ7_HIBSY|nr:putative F-box family protein [Hibiscus syriacus]
MLPRWSRALTHLSKLPSFNSFGSGKDFNVIRRQSYAAVAPAAADSIDKSFPNKSVNLDQMFSKQSKSIRGANVIYRRVLLQVDKHAIYEVFNLEKTFQTTFSLLLHMWLCLRRLKAEGKEGVELGQYVYEIYNHDVELRVSKAGGFHGCPHRNFPINSMPLEGRSVLLNNWNIFSDDTSKPDAAALRTLHFKMPMYPSFNLLMKTDSADNMKSV